MSINVANITKQLSRVENENSQSAVLSRPMSLHRNELILNPNNTAAENDTQESIEQLADSISASGLIHPITVNKISDHKYMILSGERRYKAITSYLDWEYIPCTVYENLDKDLVTVVTVQANLQAREYSSSDKLRLYGELEKALKGLKADGKYRGGISRGIANLLGVSEQQVWKYKKITSELSGEEVKEVKNINDTVKKISDSEKAESPRASQKTEYAFGDKSKIKAVKDIINALKATERLMSWSSLSGLNEETANVLYNAYSSLLTFQNITNLYSENLN